ncbi:hypothetical protein CKAH01_09302, partial [Colletotrichum kahawae]
PCASLPAPIDRYPCSGSQLGSLWDTHTRAHPFRLFSLCVPCPSSSQALAVVRPVQRQIRFLPGPARPDMDAHALVDRDNL